MRQLTFRRVPRTAAGGFLPTASTGQGRLGAAILVVFLGLLMALVFGLGISVLPWYLVVGFCLVLFVAPMLAIFPSLGMVLILMLVYEAIPGRFVPALPLGGGTLKIYDALFIITGFIVVLRTWAKGGTVIEPVRPVLIPLLYTFTCVLVSLVYGRLMLGSTLAVAEARSAICWLMLPMLLLVIDQPRKYTAFMWMLIVIAVITSMYALIQSFFDVRILAHRVEDLSGGAVQAGGVTRSIIGAASFLGMFAMYYAFMTAAVKRVSWWIAVPVILICAMGLAVSFTRALWLSGFVGALVAFYIYRGVRATIFACIGILVAGAISLGIVALAKPRMAESVVDRALGIGSEIRSGGSFDWRRLENEAAFKVIAAHPLMGVGMGGEYKKVKTFVGEWNNEYNFIHNGYMFYPLKMGLHGLLIPLLFIGVFVAEIGRAHV